MKEVRVLCDRAGNATVYLDRHVGVNVGLGAPLELPQLFIPRIGIYMNAQDRIANLLMGIIASFRSSRSVAIACISRYSWF